MIRIMLQEQTLGRQLKLCSKGLKRSRYGSLHAYLPIGLAVETSQPHVVRVQRYAINFIFFWACPSVGLYSAAACGGRASIPFLGPGYPLYLFWEAARCRLPKKDAASIPHAAPDSSKN